MRSTHTSGNVERKSRAPLAQLASECVRLALLAATTASLFGVALTLLVLGEPTKAIVALFRGGRQ